MNFAFVLAGLLANYFIFVDTISESEPQCYSRFDYEFKVVEKLFTLETAYKKQQEINQELKDALDEMKNMSNRKEGNTINLFICMFVCLFYFIYLFIIFIYLFIYLLSFYLFFLFIYLSNLFIYLL